MASLDSELGCCAKTESDHLRVTSLKAEEGACYLGLSETASRGSLHFHAVIFADVSLTQVALVVNPLRISKQPAANPKVDNKEKEEEVPHRASDSKWEGIFHPKTPTGPVSGSGRMARRQDRVPALMRMAMCMRVNGKMARRKGREPTAFRAHGHGRGGGGRGRLTFFLEGQRRVSPRPSREDGAGQERQVPRQVYIWCSLGGLHRRPRCRWPPSWKPQDHL